MLPIGLDKVGEQTRLRMAAAECLRSQLLDLLEGFLSARILKRGEFAHEHRHLDHLGRVGVSHPLRSAVWIEADAPLFAGVVEGLLVGVGPQFVSRPQLVDELFRILSGILPTEGGRQDQPRAIPLSQRVHGLGVDLRSGKPRRGQPSLGCCGRCRRRGSQHHDHRQQTACGRG